MWLYCLGYIPGCVGPQVVRQRSFPWGSVAFFWCLNNVWCQAVAAGASGMVWDKCPGQCIKTQDSIRWSWREAGCAFQQCAHRRINYRHMWRCTHLSEPCHHGETHQEARKYNLHVTIVQPLLRYGQRPTFSVTILYHLLRCYMYVIMHVHY